MKISEIPDSNRSKQFNEEIYMPFKDADREKSAVTGEEEITRASIGH